MILQTESSCGWGGQEIRILREACGMRDLGHEVLLATAQGAPLAKKGREAGFCVYELPFQKKWALYTFFKLREIIRKHNIALIHTHSSLDAWIGGFAARLSHKKIVRTRYLSTPIRPGLNSRILYNYLADAVVTTSYKMAPMIESQAGLIAGDVTCVPTGVDPLEVKADPVQVARWREKLKVREGDLLLGTLCVVRSWKGIEDLLLSAYKLKSCPRYKWVIIGGGYLKEFRALADRLQLQSCVTFTGHIDAPYDVLGACDIFLLLSTANEGISQATLQAAYLGKPLITTDVGGLTEVCIPGKTGIVVPPGSPTSVMKAVLDLEDPELRFQYGKNARALVEEKFLFEQTLASMEKVYAQTL